MPEGNINVCPECHGQIVSEDGSDSTCENGHTVPNFRVLTRVLGTEEDVRELLGIAMHWFGKVLCRQNNTCVCTAQQLDPYMRQLFAETEEAFSGEEGVGGLRWIGLIEKVMRTMVPHGPEIADELRAEVDKVMESIKHGF